LTMNFLEFVALQGCNTATAGNTGFVGEFTHDSLLTTGVVQILI
jgi:hypothetical protein